MPRRTAPTQPAAERTGGDALADRNRPGALDNHPKDRLAAEINRLLDERKLTQAAAAKVLGVSQPKVSALRHHRLTGFSLERLMRLLNTLGQEFEIVPRRPGNPRPRSTAIMTRRTPQAWSRTPTGEPLKRSGKEKWSRLLAHVEEWMKDESGYDERAWPEILRGLNEDRMSYRSRG